MSKPRLASALRLIRDAIIDGSLASEELIGDDADGEAKRRARGRLEAQRQNLINAISELEC